MNPYHPAGLTRKMATPTCRFPCVGPGHQPSASFLTRRTTLDLEHSTILAIPGRAWACLYHDEMMASHAVSFLASFTVLRAPFAKPHPRPPPSEKRMLSVYVQLVILEDSETLEHINDTQLIREDMIKSQIDMSRPKQTIRRPRSGVNSQSPNSSGLDKARRKVLNRSWSTT